MGFREFTRSDRMSAQLLRLIAVIVREQFEYNEELKHVAISDVDVTKDLSVAKVYFNTLFPKYKDEALVTLKENAPFIRSILSQQVRARSVPELRFIYDESLERGASLEALISEARATDPNLDEEE
jgi:ribosome-binding factor A